MTTYVVSDAGGWVPLDSSGLPNSGVTAGTYGDSTHVAQVTVNAKGQVTAASDVLISGAGGGVGAILFSSVLGADAASIDTGVGGIAGGYNYLRMLFVGRTDEAVVLSSLSFTLNNDTGANYDFVWTGTSNTTAITGNNTAQTAWNVQTLGASAGANFAGAVQFDMAAYAGTTFYKAANWLTTRADGSAAANMSMLNFGGSYRSTAAVSRLAVTPLTGGAKLKAGSALYIYGF